MFKKSQVQVAALLERRGSRVDERRPNEPFSTPGWAASAASATRWGGNIVRSVHPVPTLAPCLAVEARPRWRTGKTFRIVVESHSGYLGSEGLPVKYRTLGRTGIKVSPYGLGALMFATRVGNRDPQDSIEVIHKALDAGINLVDTADAYGDSEEVVGRALKGRRDNVVLTTKVGRPMGPDPNQQGGSRRWIMTAVENSLRRLQTDHIDVYQIQRPDPETDIEETLSALTSLVHSGKIRTFGTSTMPASDLVQAQWVAERRGLERFSTEQPPYSILTRGIEREVLPVAQQFGTGILVWGPLGQGMLTGRVRRGQDNDVTRAQFMTAFRDEQRLDAVELLIQLAEEAGLSMAHLAMAFAISHPGVTSALLGVRTMQHLDDLLAGVDVVLSDDVLDRIDEIVAPGTDIGTLDQAYVPPAIRNKELRRRPRSDRSAAGNSH
jgi:aryl-alcohol dehydrogenase-like predicted oxidoreductase